MKSGDTVKIKDVEYFNKALKQSGLLCVEADIIREMREFNNKESRISGFDKDGYIILEIDNGNYLWTKYDFQ